MDIWKSGIALLRDIIYAHSLYFVL